MKRMRAPMEMIAIEGRLMPAVGSSGPPVPPIGWEVGVGDPPLPVGFGDASGLGEGVGLEAGLGEASGLGEGEALIPEEGKLVEERMVSVAGEG